MQLKSSTVEELIRLVKIEFPTWDGFSHPPFVEDEVDYKRQAAAKAQDLLSRPNFTHLLEARQYDELRDRFRTVAQATNLLYLAVPSSGDMRLIFDPKANPVTLYPALYELLHGAGGSPGRVGAFYRYLHDNGLPSYWTFPTYFLFLLHPAGEVFIKPSIVRWFAETFGDNPGFPKQPSSGETAAREYGELCRIFQELLDALQPYGARDFVDVQSLIYVARKAAAHDQTFTAAVVRLREALDYLAEDEELKDQEVAKSEVLGHYQPIFAPAHIPELTAEEYRSFLVFKNNRHWTGINRFSSRTTSNMDQLRAALAILLDESRPLAERYDEATSAVIGLGRATATPILLVFNIDEYGVWNSKSEAGLRQLNLYPDLPRGSTDGQQYEAVNRQLKRLAEALGVDLWNLDTLWEVMNRESFLAEPFNKIFADRAEAESVLDLFAETVERLGGGPGDERFALTLRHKQTMLRLNFGGWLVLDFSTSRGLGSLALLVEPTRSQHDFASGLPFADDERLAVFDIPTSTLKEMPEGLENTYEASMSLIEQRFRNWEGTPYRHAHQQPIFEALFDLGKRSELLRKGYFAGEMAEQRYWAVSLPRRHEVQDETGESHTVDVWQVCFERGMAAVDADSRPESSRPSQFALIRPGDGVLALTGDGAIRGVGTAKTPLDERLMQKRPREEDYFGGTRWQRVEVDWQREHISLVELPPDIRTKLRQGLVVELNEQEFDAVRQLMARTETPKTPPVSGEPSPAPDPYNEQDFLAATHLAADAMQELQGMLEDRRQIIFYGPPGTGKTYVARHVGRLLTGLAEPPAERLEIVQFHPAYSYEDFIEGIRPTSIERNGRYIVDYPPKAGVFRRFCENARNTDGPCVFIVDEINRGNIPRIFGELMLLLEYRDERVPLPYSGERFSIPANVHIIGTMNTADRSIALVDFALRRRFHLFRFAADPDLFERWLADRPRHVPYIAELYRRLSQEAIDDPDFAIGPSYFMRNELTEQQLEAIWRRSVMPYLYEYYFDQPKKAERWAWDGNLLRGVRRGEYEE